MGFSSERDFDFFIGSWSVKHRRLSERLSNSSNWQEFHGTCVMRTLLGGLANIDDNVIDLPGGAYHAATLRSYDATSHHWAIWWLDSRLPLQIDPPVMGTFDNGVGTFFADDVFQGRPIRVRFKWMNTTGSAPEWEQAFSPDGGNSWEPNWTMRFERQAL